MFGSIATDIMWISIHQKGDVVFFSFIGEKGIIRCDEGIWKGWNERSIDRRTAASTATTFSCFKTRKTIIIFMSEKK